MKLSVKLQAPTIELEIEAKDASGKKDKIVVGFKRYEIDEANTKIEILKDLLESAKTDQSLQLKELDSYLEKEIVYILKATLNVEEDSKTKELTVTDTRVAKPIADLWENGEECLSVLLKMYLSSSPYRLALILAAQKALFNSDFNTDRLGN